MSIEHPEVDNKRNEWAIGMGVKGFEDTRMACARESERRMTAGGGEGRRDDSMVIVGRIGDRVVFREADEDGVAPNMNEIPAGEEESVAYSLVFENNPLNKGVTEKVMNIMERHRKDNSGPR